MARSPYILLIFALLLCMVVIPTATADERPRATATFTPLPTTIADRITDALGGKEQPEAGDEGLDWTGLLQEAYDAYETPLGPLAAIIIFAIPFLMMWIAQRDMTIPGIVGAVIGLFIIIRLPANFHVLAVTFIAISVVAVIYSLMKERV